MEKMKVSIQYKDKEPNYLLLSSNEWAFLDWLFERGYLKDDVIYTELNNIVYKEF